MARLGELIIKSLSKKEQQATQLEVDLDRYFAMEGIDP